MNLNLYENYDGMLMREMNNSMRNADPDKTGMTSRFPKNTPIAMAYVPYQQWGEVYDCKDAFERGTLFPELDLPFEKGGASR